ncbi:MAG: hypothetical protein ACM31E_03350 [Fibrobacterota bacterium]
MTTDEISDGIKLAAIDTAREKTHKNVGAKETVANAADTLKSVPTFTIQVHK